MQLRRKIAQPAAICLLVLPAPLAGAQERDQGAKECIPKKQESDRATIEMYGTLVPAAGSPDVPPLYLATLLQEIQLSFRAPDTIAQLSSGQMSLWLHAEGRLTNPREADTLLPPELVRTLSAAVDSTSRRGGIGPVFPQLGADSVPLHLVVYYANKRTPLSVPLLRVALPRPYFEFEVEKPALAQPGNPAPRYPKGLREAGVEGEVLAQFVVSREGRAEMGSFHVLKGSHNDFVNAVREALPRMRFYPAEVAGCRVRQLLQLPFAFKLNW